MFKIFLYGIGGAGQQYRVLNWYGIDESEMTSGNVIETIRYQAAMMKVKNPSIEHVYAVGYRPGLRWDFVRSIKENSIESCAIFKDILEREGIKIF